MSVRRCQRCSFVVQKFCEFEGTSCRTCGNLCKMPTGRPYPKLVSLHVNLTPPNAVVFELDHPYMVASKRSCIQQPQQSLQQPRQPQWQPRKQRQHQRPDNNDEVSKVPGETHVKVLSVVCEAHFHVSSFLFPSTSWGCWGCWGWRGRAGGRVRSKVFAKNRSADFYGIKKSWESFCTSYQDGCCHLTRFERYQKYKIRASKDGLRWGNLLTRKILFLSLFVV